MDDQKLPDKLLKLQERARIVEKNPSLNILEYMAKDYDSPMSANDMERKYGSPPINFQISSSAIGQYLKKFCHKQLRQGTEKIEKSRYFLR
jgi:hypothetical protein